MSKFSAGESAIDTKKNLAVTIGAIIPSPCGDLYVVSSWEEDSDYYITNEENLIEYDKYYFDRWVT